MSLLLASFTFTDVRAASKCILRLDFLSRPLQVTQQRPKKYHQK